MKYTSFRPNKNKSSGTPRSPSAPMPISPGKRQNNKQKQPELSRHDPGSTLMSLLLAQGAIVRVTLQRQISVDVRGQKVLKTTVINLLDDPNFRDGETSFKMVVNTQGESSVQEFVLPHFIVKISARRGYRCARDSEVRSWCRVIPATGRHSTFILL